MTSNNGSPGAAPGGGGGGQTVNGTTGGAGAAGQVKLTWATESILVMSISSVAGTDQYGNNYTSGFAVYDASNNVVLHEDLDSGITQSFTQDNVMLQQTNTVQSNNGFIQQTHATTSSIGYKCDLAGDAHSRFILAANGEMQWGNGTAGVDTALNRTGSAALGVTGSLSTSTSLTAGTSLAVTGAATVGTTLGVTGNTSLSTLGTSGLATLNSASVTNALSVGTTITATGGTFANQTQIATDTWHAVTPATGWTQATGSNPQMSYKLIAEANSIWISGSMTHSGAPSGGNLMFTLPVGYRPLHAIHVFVGYESSTPIAFQGFQIDTSGNVTIQSTSSSTATTQNFFINAIIPLDLPA